MTYLPGASLISWKLAHAGSNGGGGPKRKVGEEIFGDGPYPHSMTEFIGQERAKNQLLTAMLHAKESGTVMDHVLLASGTPGVGKTTLAKLVAYMLNVGVIELAGLVGDREVKLALHQMRRGDVLFLDEVHRLVNRGKSRAEWLLTLLQDGELVTPTGVVTSPGITVIAATTDAQKLPETILDRFKLQPILDPYSCEEATQIALGQAKRLGFSPEASPLVLPVSNAWLVAVAEACNRNPRRMDTLLTNLRNIVATGSGLLTEDGWDLAQALSWGGLTTDGLDSLAQGYLTGLLAYGGTAGIATLRALLNEEQLRHTEKLLIQKGMVQVTTRGRELTGLGLERAQALVEEVSV